MPEVAPDPQIQTEIVPQPPGKGVTAVYRSKGELMRANFLGGISWGFGSVIGATLVVAAVLILFKVLGGIPFIGSFINDIAQSLNSAHH